MSRTFAFVVFVSGLHASFAQTARMTPKFEVASVHRAYRQNEMPVLKGGPGTADPGLITYTNIALAGLISKAYGVRVYQIHSRSSLTSERYDVEARVPTGASIEDLKLMLQELLRDRFKLSMHRETHEGQTYNLQVDSVGFKLKEAKDAGAEHGSIEFDEQGNQKFNTNVPLGTPVTLAGKGITALAQPGHIIIFAQALPVSALADQLARCCLQAPVVDRTGAKGNYTFTLNFGSDELPVSSEASPDCPLCAAPGDQPLSIDQETGAWP